MALVLRDPRNGDCAEIPVYPSGAILGNVFRTANLQAWYDHHVARGSRRPQVLDARYLDMVVAVYAEWYNNKKFDTEVSGFNPEPRFTPATLRTQLEPYLGCKVTWTVRRSFSDMLSAMLVRAVGGYVGAGTARENRAASP
jgi:hypothetical protein